MKLWRTGDHVHISGWQHWLLRSADTVIHGHEIGGWVPAEETLSSWCFSSGVQQVQRSITSTIWVRLSSFVFTLERSWRLKRWLLSA